MDCRGICAAAPILKTGRLFIRRGIFLRLFPEVRLCPDRFFPMFSRMEGGGAAVRSFPWGVSRLVLKDSGSAPAAIMLLFVTGFLAAGIGIAGYCPASRQTSAVLGAAVIGYAAYESDIFMPCVKEHARQNAAPGLPPENPQSRIFARNLPQIQAKRQAFDGGPANLQNAADQLRLLDGCHSACMLLRPL